LTAGGHKSETFSPIRTVGSALGFAASLIIGIIGVLVFAGGFAAAGKYFMMDTSVEVPTQEVFGNRIGGGRVHNIGLMDERRTGLIFSSVVAGVGHLMAFMGSKGATRNWPR